MNDADRLKDYLNLCGLQQKEVKTLGGYSKSLAYLCDILNSCKPMNRDTEKEIYTCINVARTKKQQGETDE